jgi:hypothetical protein
VSAKETGRLQRVRPARDELFPKTLPVIAAATLLSCSSHDSVETAQPHAAPVTEEKEKQPVPAAKTASATAPASAAGTH